MSPVSPYRGLHELSKTALPSSSSDHSGSDKGQNKFGHLFHGFAFFLCDHVGRGLPWRTAFASLEIT